MADVDLLDFAIGHEALEASESATNALDHVESYEANEAHVVGESHDYSREQVDGPEDDDELGEAEHVPGYGKVYVRFATEADSEKAKVSLYKRRFNGRPVEIIYYPLEKFLKNQFD